MLKLSEDSYRLAELLTISKKVNGALSREDRLNALLYVCKTTKSKALKDACNNYLRLRSFH